MIICEIKHCNKESSIIYKGHDVCNTHWNKHCDDDNNFNLDKEFKIKEKNIIEIGSVMKMDNKKKKEIANKILDYCRDELKIESKDLTKVISSTYQLAKLMKK